MAVTLVQKFGDYNRLIAYWRQENEEMPFAEGEDAEQLLQTDRNVCEPLSSLSSEGSNSRNDITIRNLKMQMQQSEDNVSQGLKSKDHLTRLNKSRRGTLSVVAANKNKMNTLLMEDAHVMLVKEKFECLKRLFDRYFDAHRVYQRELLVVERTGKAKKQYKKISYRDFAGRVIQ